MDSESISNHQRNITRVLLTGTYCSKNKGDATMQAVFTSKFRQSRPDADVIIASPFPEQDESYYRLASVIRSRRRNLPLATMHWLTLEALKALGVSPARYPLNAEINAMIQSDAVVDLSGDMLTEDYGPLVGFSHFLPLLQAQALGRPVAICAQSIGPFNWLAPLARRILSRARLITVRESLSIKVLQDMQSPSTKPLHTADLAFMLEPASSERIAALRKEEGILEQSRLRLGISVSALLANKTNRYLSAEGLDKLAIFAKALDVVAEKLDIEILLVPHVFGPRPSGDDRQVAMKLAGLMKSPVHCILGEYRPEEIKGLIASCDVFVGCRMHANIAALDSGVPVLAVGYSHKTRGILKDLGLEEWVLPVSELGVDRLSAAVLRLFKEAQVYREQLASLLPGMRKRSQDNIDAVVRLIDSCQSRRVR